MSIVTVFRSRLREGVEEEYAAVAQKMSDLVRAVDGFVDQKFYVASDGERVTIVRFRDAASHATWARHPDHLDAQRHGRDHFYSWYDISVCDELHHAVFDSPGEPSGSGVRRDDQS